MEYLIAVFRSRTQVMKFCEKLRTYRIVCNIINTPREASLGCGLSVKFNTFDYNRVRRVLSMENYPTFAGVFTVSECGNKKTVRPF